MYTEASMNILSNSEPLNGKKKATMLSFLGEKEKTAMLALIGKLSRKGQEKLLKKLDSIEEAYQAKLVKMRHEV